MRPSSARLAAPEKIAITMSEPSARYVVTSLRAYTTERLLEQIIRRAEQMLAWEARYHTPSAAAAERYGRQLETLCALVDELARRA